MNYPFKPRWLASRGDALSFIANPPTPSSHHKRTAVSCIISLPPFLISASHIKHPVSWTELYKDSTANQHQHFYRKRLLSLLLCFLLFYNSVCFIFFLHCLLLTSVFYLIPLACSALFQLKRQTRGPFINVLSKPKNKKFKKRSQGACKIIKCVHRGCTFGVINTGFFKGK